MKYYTFAILFSTFFSLQDLKAIPAKDDVSSSYSELQDAPPNTPRKASSMESVEEVEIDIEQAAHTKKKKIKGDEKKDNHWRSLKKNILREWENSSSLFKDSHALQTLVLSQFQQDYQLIRYGLITNLIKIQQIAPVQVHQSQD